MRSTCKLRWLVCADHTREPCLFFFVFFTFPSLSIDVCVCVHRDGWKGGMNFPKEHRGGDPMLHSTLVSVSDSVDGDNGPRTGRNH